MITLDSFKRSGGPGSLKDGSVLFISDLFPVTGFDHIVIIELIYQVMKTAHVGERELIGGLPKTISVIDFCCQSVIDCANCEALILEVDFVDCVVDQLCDSSGSLLRLLIVFQFTFLGASTEEASLTVPAGLCRGPDLASRPDLS